MIIKEISFEQLKDYWIEVNHFEDPNKNIVEFVSQLGSHVNSKDNALSKCYGLFDNDYMIGGTQLVEWNNVLRYRTINIREKYRGQDLGWYLIYNAWKMDWRKDHIKIMGWIRNTHYDWALNHDFYSVSDWEDDHIMMERLMTGYCPLPYIMLSTLPSGQTRLCCKTVNNHVPDGNLNDKTVNQIWNGDYYKDIRNQMDNDEFPSDCEVCYREDRLGKRSMRLKELEIWGVEEKAENPYYLDLRMGNLCNLKCRTCDSVSSSQIHKESKELDYMPVFFRQKAEEADTMKPWWEKEDIRSLLPTAKLLWMSGGEPTLVQAGKEFIDYCIENNYAKDIKLRYVINLTNVTEEFIEKFEQFKSVDFHCSIDGLNEVNDYLRYPSKFEVLEDNLDRLQYTNANLLLVINTISLFNIYRLPELIDWIDEFYKVKLNINPLNEPFMYHMNILDDDTKAEIKDKLLSYETTPKLKQEIKSLIELMETKPLNIDESRRDFYKFVTEQDRVRGQDFCSTFPELKRFYEICKHA